MKTSFKITQGLFKQFFLLLTVAILFFSSISCSKENMDCEENNAGTLIIENSRSIGTLKIFFDQEPRSGNVAGDLNILPGETANSDQLAGQRIIYALLDNSTCNDGTCFVRNETLPARTVDLSACEDFNIVY